MIGAYWVQIQSRINQAGNISVTCSPIGLQCSFAYTVFSDPVIFQGPVTLWYSCVYRESLPLQACYDSLRPANGSGSVASSPEVSLTTVQSCLASGNRDHEQSCAWKGCEGKHGGKGELGKVLIVTQIGGVMCGSLVGRRGRRPRVISLLRS